MPKFELKKTIEAQKLNPRTRIPLADPPVTISFGAILEDIEEDRDWGKFLYLGKPYRCPLDILMAALASRPLAEGPPAAGKAPAEALDSGPQMNWEQVKSPHHTMFRAKTPGGWMVIVDSSAFFYPDPKHQWDGSTLP